MTDVSLSLAEKTYILHGVDANFRNDGRERYQYRWIEIETKTQDPVNGFARVRKEDTDILVGVKVEIDTPYPDRPHEGKLDFSVYCSPGATINMEGKAGDDLATEISNSLALAYSSPEAFDLRNLSILPHKKCWAMFIDISVYQCGGNLLDTVSIAVKAALYNTEIPKITAATLDGGEADIQISDDIYDCVKMDVSNFPIFVSLCKIGDNYIVDPTVEEKACTSASLMIAVMPNNKITTVVKRDYGSLQPTTLLKMLQVGTKIGVGLNQNVMQALKREEEIGPKRPVYGFLK